MPTSWTERLQKENLTEEAFTACMAEAITERLTGARVEVAGLLKLHVHLGGGFALACALGGLWQETRRNPDLRVERNEAYLQSLQEKARRCEAQSRDGQQAGDQPGRKAVLPTMQNAAFVQQANQRYEQAGTSEHLCARPFAGGLLAEELFVVYVLDTPASLTFMTDRRREKLSISPEEIGMLALTNLSEVLPAIEVSARIDERPGGPLVCEVSCGGTYETSLLLVPALCAQMAGHVPGRMVAGVPARGQFLFAGSEDARGLEHLAAEIEALYRERRYPLSELLMLEDGRWTPYEMRS